MATVTISREEYDRLREAAEMMADIQAYDAAKDDEGIPHDFAMRLIEGDSPVAVYRDWRGLSQAELARLSGVNRVQILDIEKGRKNGSVDTLKKLADALGATVDDLV